MMPDVLILTGPTGSGKSALAVYLAKACGGEIVSCDSMLIYKGMNIGTDKPSVKQRRGIRHHCLDLITPRQTFNVYDFVAHARKAVRQIKKRGKPAIVVGGSGLYIRLFLNGMADQPSGTAAARKNLEKQLAAKGLPYLRRRLQRIDPRREREITSGDSRRIIRALEIYDSCRVKPSVWRQEGRSLQSLGYSWTMAGLMRERADLYDRIEKRIDRMIHNGFVNEVKRLKRSRLSVTARQAIGYAEILSYLNKRTTLERAVSAIKKRSRHLAKKQLTWFRRDKQIRWVYLQPSAESSEAKDAVLRLAGGFN